MDALVKGEVDAKRPTTAFRTHLFGESYSSLAERYAELRRMVPSNSRMNLGPIFFPSALHCARTRTATRVASCLSFVSSSTPRCFRHSAGSHHQPWRSTPPSPLPPTRRRDMDRWSRRTRRDLFSKVTPLRTVETTAEAVDISTEAPRGAKCGGRDGSKPTSAT